MDLYGGLVVVVHVQVVDVDTLRRASSLVGRRPFLLIIHKGSGSEVVLLLPHNHLLLVVEKRLDDEWSIVAALSITLGHRLHPRYSNHLPS